MATLTYKQRIDCKKRNFDRLQESVNYTNLFNPEYTRSQILAIAISTHAEFPQYEGRWDNWTVVKINQDLITKAGVDFKENDMALMKPDDGTQGKNQFVTCYSIRNSVDTAVPFNYIT